MQITTLPVYSKLADEAEVLATFGDRTLPQRLSQHQLATYRALCDPDVDVVINTAMTGDGKSLAGQLPLLHNNRNILALFPTNELVQDQYRSAEQSLPDWGMKASRAGIVSGPVLDELHAAAAHLSRPETLLREMENHKLLLSNPDMLHAILQFYYQQIGRAPTHIAGSMGLRFDQFTFDEFHIFDTAQVIAVLTGMLFLYEQSAHPLKTLFLSATPDERLLAPLQRVGFGSKLSIINPRTEGWYAHGANPGDGWRNILQGSAITFVNQQAEEWMPQGVQEVLLPWFERYGSGAKAAMIVNSVATALRLVEFLKRTLPPSIRVEPNTALNGRSTRKASYDADVLVGTSTVDVGVDFRINLLIFEADSAGTFMQRLGRLGRHTGYTDEHLIFHPFNEFAAVALVRPYILERLSAAIDGQPPRLRAGDTVQRDQLADIINETYPAPADFKHYTRLWGRFQPARVIATLSDKRIRMTFADVRERLKERYHKLTGASMSKAVNEGLSYKQSGEGLLVEEAQSFRGSSSFECAVLKPDEDEMLTYDLFWLLAHVRLEYVAPSAFNALVSKLQQPPRTRQIKQALFHFRWRGLFDIREPLYIKLTPRVSAWGAERHHTAQVLPGFAIDCRSQPSINTLNDTLIQHQYVALLIPDYEPQQAKRSLYLPPHLPLWPYRTNDDLGSGSIAFGRWALLLDSKLRYQRSQSGDTPMIC
jgi:CRISPR-associated endonuclease/helicase Cas3